MTGRGQMSPAAVAVLEAKVKDLEVGVRSAKKKVLEVVQHATALLDIINCIEDSLKSTPRKIVTPDGSRKGSASKNSTAIARKRLFELDTPVASTSKRTRRQLNFEDDNKQADPDYEQSSSSSSSDSESNEDRKRVTAGPPRVRKSGKSTGLPVNPSPSSFADEDRLHESFRSWISKNVSTKHPRIFNVSRHVQKRLEIYLGVIFNEVHPNPCGLNLCTGCFYVYRNEDTGRFQLFRYNLATSCRNHDVDELPLGMELIDYRFTNAQLLQIADNDSDSDY